jgi:dTDP-glucose 4,6-dehydratase
MKIILITGGAGFLGSHLCTFLLAKKYKVICVDNCVTGNVANIEDLKDNSHFTFIPHDIITPITIEEPVDYILHFASPASPLDYQKIPIKTLDVGSFGTKNALELSRQKKAVFLLASTSEVYGDPLVSPQQETYFGNVNSIGPRSCYDESKRFAEALTMAYHRTYNIDTKIVRIFNTYGPKMRINDGRVIPAFISQALRGEPLTIFGNGKQTRSFCYVDDLIKGIYGLLTSDVHDPVNIGNPNEFTMLALAQKILTLTGSTSIISFHPLPLDDPKQRKPDITRARTLLHWEPTISLDEGLEKTIHWFKEQLS